MSPAVEVRSFSVVADRKHQIGGFYEELLTV
jgi:hypothetical protein